MYKEKNVSVIVPAYNESINIAQVLNSMPEFIDQIIVVDDCSHDGTYDTARAIPDGRLPVIATRINLGVGGAVKTGYRQALKTKTDILVKMDGDGQMSPEYLPILLDALIEQKYDYVKGNRFLHSDALVAMPKHRLIGNIVLTFMTKLSSGYWHIFDPQNGYTAINADALRMINLDSIHNRYFFENDMLINLNIHNFHAKDVSMPAKYGDESSKLNPFKISLTFPFLLSIKFFMRIYQKYVLRDFSPIALFLFVGMGLFLWGTIFGAYSWIKNIHSNLPTPTGTIMLSVLPLILGFQLILEAIVLDIQASPK